MKEKLKKATKVPSTPNNSTIEKLPKKSPLYMLKPDANTIGGKQKKKNVLSLNCRRFTTSVLFFANSQYEISMPISTE